ncbi:tyrosine-type recombinase/integrase [uncultured Cohaesibacter sp.]|uniref:tyrosine-type recombinase/integrase n=1 Tax=uncultured Cohaesibacter sp. TaxID=1002546 RepID=UPI0029C8CE26|nr:tyrosine-type recombinase/integrase [uncultured Cohaesibacter sp.]
MMKINFPGLIEEPLPSGNMRYRVRVEGQKKRRITLSVTPDHADFREHYLAARRGIRMGAPESEALQHITEGSLQWLIEKYLIALEKKVKAGLHSEATLVQRRSLLSRLIVNYGKYSKDMPSSYVVRIRDEMAETPGAADNMVKSIRAMYSWANETGFCKVNPAKGVEKINHKRNAGAVPWTIDDLKQFRERHPKGTNAYLCLTLLMFTACRISDAVALGRQNEFEENGIRWIGWQPKKEGSAYVEIPMLPPLYEATRAAKVQGLAYLLTDHGRPFKSEKALGNRFRKWCDQARLEHLSAHGIRKATGHLLAKAGCTQYQIMAIQGHTQAKTSEVYTKGVERRRLAADAMDNLRTLDW